MTHNVWYWWMNIMFFRILNKPLGERVDYVGTLNISVFSLIFGIVSFSIEWELRMILMMLDINKLSAIFFDLSKKHKYVMQDPYEAFSISFRVSLLVIRGTGLLNYPSFTDQVISVIFCECTAWYQRFFSLIMMGFYLSLR